MTGKMFTISEEDLALLESELPRLMESQLGQCNDPMVRKRWESVKHVLSEVRWGYGPPSEVIDIIER